MSEGNKRKIKYCIYCGADIEEGKVYCPKCGKLAIKKKPRGSSQLKSLPIKEEFTRKCSGCGSLISSTRIQQCPICNAVLEKIPAHLKPKPEKQSGFIFADKKLQPEHKFEIRKESWNSREGYRVFEASIFSYLAVLMLILMVLSTQMNPDTLEIEQNVVTVLLETVPVIALGIYPIYYILAKKNSFKKLGLNPNAEELILALALGVLGGFGLYLLNLLSDFAFSTLVNAGFENFVTYHANVIEFNQIVKNSGFLILFYCLLTSLMAIATEIAYRGVLHNTLKQKFGEKIKGKLVASLLVALVYAGINILVFLISDLYIGFFLFITDFMMFFLLGILYELNGNLYNTIIAHVFYNLLIVLVIFLF